MRSSEQLAFYTEGGQKTCRLSKMAPSARTVKRQLEELIFPPLVTSDVLPVLHFILLLRRSFRFTLRCYSVDVIPVARRFKRCSRFEFRIYSLDVISRHNGIPGSHA